MKGKWNNINWHPQLPRLQEYVFNWTQIFIAFNLLSWWRSGIRMIARRRDATTSSAYCSAALACSSGILRTGSCSALCSLLAAHFCTESAHAAMCRWVHPSNNVTGMHWLGSRWFSTLFHEMFTTLFQRLFQRKSIYCRDKLSKIFAKFRPLSLSVFARNSISTFYCFSKAPLKSLQNLSPSS